MVYFGDDDTYLYALDVESGQQLWRFDTGGRINCTPAISAGVVCFSSGDGSLYALDASSGEQLWSFQPYSETAYRPAQFDKGGLSPAILGELVFVRSDFRLHALDIETGKEVWKFMTSTSNVPSVGRCSSPVIAGTTVYVASDGAGDRGGYLYALDGQTGDKIWEFETSGAIVSSPTIWNGVIYFGTADGYLYAVK